MKLEPEQIEREREKFEEAAFAQRFLSSVVKNKNVPRPRISGALDYVSEDCPMKVDFVAKNGDGTYKEESLNPAWWAWQKRAEAEPLSFVGYNDDDEGWGKTMPEYLENRYCEGSFAIDSFEVGEEFYVDAVYSRSEKWRITAGPTLETPTAKIAAEFVEVNKE